MCECQMLQISQSLSACLQRHTATAANCKSVYIYMCVWVHMHSVTCLRCLQNTQTHTRTHTIIAFNAFNSASCTVAAMQHCCKCIKFSHTYTNTNKHWFVLKFLLPSNYQPILLYLFADHFALLERPVSLCKTGRRMCALLLLLCFCFPIR